MPHVKMDIITKYNSPKKDIHVPKIPKHIWVLYMLKRITRIYYTKMLLDRETLTIVALIVCLAATAYLYKEFALAKTELVNIKKFCNKLATPPRTPAKTISIKEEPETETTVVADESAAETGDN